MADVPEGSFVNGFLRKERNTLSLQLAEQSELGQRWGPRALGGVGSLQEGCSKLVALRVEELRQLLRI